MSEMISQSSSFADSAKDLECHTASPTREIVEKCQQALSEGNTEEQEVLSLHMYPPACIDDPDARSVTTESEMDISFYQGEVVFDHGGIAAISDISSLSERNTLSSRCSSRFSDFFQRAKQTKLEDTRDDGYEDDISSSGFDRSHTCTPIYNNTAKSGKNQTSELLDNILGKEVTLDVDIEDDGSSEESVFHPQFNCRVVARPNAARGCRNVVPAAPDPAEIAYNIVKFETEVEKLIGEHAVATRDYRNRQLRPMFQEPREVVNPKTVTGSGIRYSKHFTNSNVMSRPLLTVRGLVATDDCLTHWMVSQQRRDSERLSSEGVEKTMAVTRMEATWAYRSRSMYMYNTAIVYRCCSDGDDRNFGDEMVPVCGFSRDEKNDRFSTVELPFNSCDKYW